MKEEALLETVAAIAKECTPEKVTRLERIVCALIRAGAVEKMGTKTAVIQAREIEKEMTAPDSRQKSAGGLEFESRETFEFHLRNALRRVFLHTAEDEIKGTAKAITRVMYGG